jgi:hypothetical protein
MKNDIQFSPHDYYLNDIIKEINYIKYLHICFTQALAMAYDSKFNSKLVMNIEPINVLAQNISKIEENSI